MVLHLQLVKFSFTFGLLVFRLRDLQFYRFILLVYHFLLIINININFLGDLLSVKIFRL